MRKILLILILLFNLFFISCFDNSGTFDGKYSDNENDSTYNVTFVLNNGSGSIIKTVKNGETVSKPTNPVKENYIFNMWCLDPTLTIEYDFSLAVNSDFVLYAKYIVDYALVTNKITTEIMKCNVTVHVKSYNTFLGFTTTYSEKTGSGIIFYESSSGVYYLLTNNHVVIKQSGYDKVSYKVEDYKGNEYTAYLMHRSAEYDLAVVYFSGSNLGIIKLGNSSPGISEEVVAVGQPKGQNNSIAYGEILAYESAPKLNDTNASESNVTFNIIRHDAYIAGGSSGGALLNMNLELVGINYAGRTDSNDNFISGCSIPINKVKEYLNLYIYS